MKWVVNGYQQKHYMKQEESTHLEYINMLYKVKGHGVLSHTEYVVMQKLYGSNLLM